jgi:energy-coupling factor transporter ATP-binding protein EcfA2
MIIVEGPDGSGKSTLVNNLARILRLPVASKVVGSDTQPLVNLRDWTETNVGKGFQPLIFDRHRLISEPIYGPAMRKRQDAEFYDLSWLSDMMWRFYQINPVIIYCLPDILTVRENVLREDTDNEAVRNHIAAIYAGYVTRASLDFTRGVGRLYNYKTTKLDDIVGWINWKIDGKVTDDQRVRLPFPRNEGIHPRSDHRGPGPAAIRARQQR